MKAVRLLLKKQAKLFYSKVGRATVRSAWQCFRFDVAVILIPIKGYAILCSKKC